MIEVLECALPASFQDLGRPGYRHLGVPLSGALDPEWLAIANALVGNPAQTVALEMRLLGPKLRATAPVTIALAGEFSAKIEDAAGLSRPAADWCSHVLATGDILSIGALRSGIGYLAVAGGFDLPQVLGSRSTYARAGLGGIDGRPLRIGDRVATGAGGADVSLRLPDAPHPISGPLRVMPGPQRDYFTDAAWQHFIGAEFVVSREADRMGLRLDGPAPRTCVRRRHRLGRSDARRHPGSRRRPPHSPAGRLPDGRRLPENRHGDSRRPAAPGTRAAGTKLRFVAVSAEEALAARRDAARRLAEWIAAIGPGGAELDLDALYGANLIDGVIDAD
jgi:biotin-dependent carboxylase-like uncharacterized protein